MMLTDLADVLRDAGLPVYEMPGWQWRGHDELVEVRAVMAHHTGSAGMPGSLNVVRDGHSTLAGPLAQLGLAPDGTFWVIAAGVCWHAGTGQWGPLPWNNGNYYAIGIEGVSNGQYWTPQQWENYPKGCAALCRRYGLGADRVCGHKEYSNAGKWDPGNWDMDAFRADVARHLAGPSAPPPPAAPQRRRRDEDNAMKLPRTETRIDEVVPTGFAGGWQGRTRIQITSNTGDSKVHWVGARLRGGQVHTLLEGSDEGHHFESWQTWEDDVPLGTTCVIVSYSRSPGGMVAYPEYER